MTNKIIIITNAILGILLIGYTIYVRFLKTRIPKDLIFLNETIINYNLLIFVLLSLITCTIVILHNIFVVINYIPKERFFTKIANKLSYMIDNALTTTYGLIVDMIPDFYHKSSYLCQKFYKYFKNKSETTFLFILYGIRLIIVSAFLIDVFIFFKLVYMYKCLLLLCISIIIKLLFFVLRDFASNIQDAKEMLIITDNGIDSETNLPITTYQLTEKYQTLNVEYYAGQFILLNKINGYLVMYDKYSNFFTPRVNIFIYSLYLIGWSYILYKNVLFIT